MMEIKFRYKNASFPSEKCKKVKHLMYQTRKTMFDHVFENMTRSGAFLVTNFKGFGHVSIHSHGHNSLSLNLVIN